MSTAGAAAALAVGGSLLAGTVLATASCGVVRGTQRMFGSTLPLEVTVVPRANDDSPVAVDLLMVYDKAVLEKVLELTARDWFQRREQLRRDHPGAIEVWSWEWVPGQEVGRQKAGVRPGARAGVLFADYFAPGDHRVRIDPRRPLRLQLGEKSLSVEPLEE